MSFESLAKIERVVVVGAGQMGAGIAQVAAQNAFEVLLVDSFPAAIEKAKAGIQKSLTKLQEKGLLKESPEAILKRLQTAFDMNQIQAFKGQLAIEAVSEKLDLKLELFARLDALMPPEALLCTNTSSIPITRIAAATKRPAQVMGMHFMNPVPLMKLVELIRGLETSDATAAAVRAAAEKMDKTCIVSQDRPGFVINRILMPMINEAFVALGEGLASAEDIDTGMKLGTNQPMGPLVLADFIGLDTCLSIMEVLHTAFGDSKYRPAPLLRNYVDSGRLGRKAGKGVYVYG